MNVAEKFPHCGSDWTARQFMHVARAFKSEIISDLNQFQARALFLLASPSNELLIVIRGFDHFNFSDQLFLWQV